MRCTQVSSALLFAALVSAHGILPGASYVFGCEPMDMRNLKSRFVIDGYTAQAASHREGHNLHVRQGGVDGRCGSEAGGASCAEGYCCS
jgi:hypothetical protein